MIANLQTQVTKNRAIGYYHKSLENNSVEAAAKKKVPRGPEEARFACPALPPCAHPLQHNVALHGSVPRAPLLRNGSSLVFLIAVLTRFAVICLLHSTCCENAEFNMDFFFMLDF